MAEDKIIRVGVVGAGEVAQTIHLPTLLVLNDRWVVTALCDVSRATLDHCAARFKLPRDGLTTSAEELCKNPNVDLVLVVCADEYHAEVAVMAADAGKHVFIEKPMALTQKDAESIIAARDRNNVVMFVGFMRRYSPAFEAAVKIVRQMKAIEYARVRDIIGMNSLFVGQSGFCPKRFNDVPSDAGNDLKARGRAIAVAALGERADDPALVRTFRLLCGLGSHDLSAMRELLGGVPERTVGALRSKANPLFITALFDYGGFMTTYETGIDNVGHFDAHLEVYGDGKRIKVTYDTPYVKGLPITLTVAENDASGAYTEKITRFTYEDCYTIQYGRLYDAIVNGAHVKTTPEDAVQDLKIFAQIVDLLSPPS